MPTARYLSGIVCSVFFLLWYKVPTVPFQSSRGVQGSSVSYNVGNSRRSYLCPVSCNVGNGRVSSQLLGPLVLASSFHVQDAWVGLICSPVPSEWWWEAKTCFREPSQDAANTCSREQSPDAFFCKCPLLIIFPLPSRSQAGVPLRTQRFEPVVGGTPIPLPLVLGPA